MKALFLWHDKIKGAAVFFCFGVSIIDQTCYGLYLNRLYNQQDKQVYLAYVSLGGQYLLFGFYASGGLLLAYAVLKISRELQSMMVRGSL